MLQERKLFYGLESISNIVKFFCPLTNFCLIFIKLFSRTVNHFFLSRSSCTLLFIFYIIRRNICPRIKYLLFKYRFEYNNLLCCGMASREVVTRTLIHFLQVCYKWLWLLFCIVIVCRFLLKRQQKDRNIRYVRYILSYK